MKIETKNTTLFEIAERQQGYFTALQAKSVGITDKNHSYHVKKGNWIREWRGIYRLKNYPFHEDEHYALWGVWSMNRKGEIQGVYSHETALAMFDLSDVNPAKIHMTVPRGFRRHSEIPQVLKLHYSQITPSECEERNGYRITKPLRTIADLIRQGKISDEFVIQAVKQSLEKGVMTQTEYKELKVMPRVGKTLCGIMGESGEQ